MRLRMQGGLGRSFDPDSSPVVVLPGLRCAVDGIYWIEGQLGVHLWLTVCLPQPEYASFLDPVEACVLAVELPTLARFVLVSLRDPTALPYDPPLANYRGPSHWGDPNTLCRSFADLQLELEFDDWELPDDTPVRLRVDLQRRVSNTIEFELGDAQPRSFLAGVLEPADAGRPADA